MAEQKQAEALPKTERDLILEFYKEYESLCKKHGFAIAIKPVWKVTNHGTYEMALENSVTRISK